ncbi:MAG TPA: DsbC family protein [Steroidobacteraceae bacterium]|jgi:thiol:disulfide interchange protein DsbC|nr:DsbC family protein [Steroidobacteraceae bacterium]
MVASKLVMSLALCVALSALAAQPAATDSAAQPLAKGDPRIEVAAHITGAHPEELRATPVPGLWELTRGTDIAYVTADGKYAFSGDLIELGTNNNLTETHRRDLRLKAIAAYPESEMLVFGPRDPKYTVTVFTDVDCPYCRKLHSQIAEYNHLGIRVRYLLYPRTGPNTTSWTKAEQVWCSSDRNEALTRAKLGEDLKSKSSCDNPVARSYALGQDFALEGTPAIIMPNGEMLAGYLPPDALMQRLKETK